MLVVIGDKTNTVRFEQLDLIDPYHGHPALRLTATSAATQPYFIDIAGGAIGGGLPHGAGIEVDRGRSAQFHLDFIGTEGPAFTLGPQAGCGFIVDGGGTERSWSYRIENGHPECISAPQWMAGDPSSRPH